jgi:bifunctional DNA-binding transcriptional regulator/antitoxin component of YhaV-PrlF toxin-antitoxin module
MNSSVVLPSLKGQITIPPEIRKRYNIGKDTPLVIKDNGNGKITITVNKMVAYNQALVEFYESENDFGLNFSKPIKASSLLSLIDKLDG